MKVRSSYLSSIRRKKRVRVNSGTAEFVLRAMMLFRVKDTFFYASFRVFPL